MFFEQCIRPILFRIGGADAETAHETVISWLEMAGRASTVTSVISALATIRSPALCQTLWGLKFPNPIGLAAGFDKNAAAIPALEALGFGFLEIGTVTRHAQPGNPRPRLFRLPKDEALINRMAFNSDGADEVAARLSRLLSRGRREVPIGISLGKSKNTPLGEAVDDYIYSLRALYEFGDYFAVNISSPNTPGLRKLQDPEGLDELLRGLAETADQLARQSNNARKPLLVKISPDLTLQALDELLEILQKRGADGVIATNTTIARDGLKTAITEEGGLSGRPLLAKSLPIIRHIRQQAPGLPIIGVGGLMSPDDALEMLNAGANLLQIYTGLIYKGPFFPKQLNAGILAAIERNAFSFAESPASPRIT